MNITVIAGYYPPEQSADTRLNQDLIEGFAERGEHVTLVAPFPTRSVSLAQQKEYVNKRHEIISDNISIYRVGKPTRYSQGLLQRGINFAIKSLQMYRLAKKIKTDVYFVVSTPPTLGYVAALLSRKNRVVYKLQDAFPDSLIHAKNLKEKTIVIKLLRLLERWVYRSVSEICTISDDLKKTIISRGVNPYKVTVIYDWIDENKCRPIAREENFLFDKFKLDRNKTYISYAGNIGTLQNLQTVVLAAERFAKSNPDLEFVIIGNGASKKEIESIIEARRINNVRLFPMQPTRDIAYVYSLGDVGLVSLKPEITKYALPSKTWDIMSAGRAVVCEIDLYSELCGVVMNNKLGYCVAPGDVDGMEKVIRTALIDKNEIFKMGQRGREYICENLTRNNAISKYIRVIKNMGGTKKSV